MSRLFRFLAVTAIGAAALVSCGTKSSQSSQEIQQAPSAISAYTSGVISRESAIRVRFAERMADAATINVELDKPLISFKPRIEGACVWSDDRTLEFRPAKPLAPATEFTATLKLAGLVDEPGAPKEFSFTFRTIEQTYDVSIEGLRAPEERDLTRQQIRGSIITADAEDAEGVEKMLTAKQGGRDLPVRWSHSDDRQMHAFTVDSVQRSDEESSVKLAWKGGSIGVNRDGEQEITVPSLGAFFVTTVKAVQGAEEFVQIEFSDPIMSNQDLRGMIRIAGKSSLRYAVDGNVVKVYSNDGWTGSADVRVERGLTNVMGRKLTKAASERVTFEELKPQVKFAGTGVILPTTQGLTVPIEVVNLKSVRVEVTQVYEKNIPQFLQINSLDGNSQMHRVGKVVWKKTVALDIAPGKSNSWSRVGLDLSPLVQKFPSGFYRLQLTFRRSDIVYRCAGSDTTQETDDGMVSAQQDQEEESSSWDSYDYDWSEYYDNRENPCHPAYYRPMGGHDVTVSRNVIISDLGVIAKRGTDDTVFVAVSDIRTAKPVAGASITIMDYQQGVLAEGKTNGDGIIRLPSGPSSTQGGPRGTELVSYSAYIVMAEFGGQKGFVRLQDGEALSVSHFDVAGNATFKGLKGFVYGERGVWRPGDTLFLTFVQFDRDNVLPGDHPVRFELRNARNQVVSAITRTQGTNGFYSFRVPTSSDAPTGEWVARVKVGNVTTTTSLKVENIVPNRLKVRAALPEGVTYLSSGSVEGDITAAWLHGASAAGLKADVEISLTPKQTTFPKFEEFTFDDPARTYEPEKSTVFDGNLDGNGTAHFEGTLDPDNVAPGMLNATLRTRVFEPGGAFSTDLLSVPFHPYSVYIGMRPPKGDKARGMLLTDTLHTVDLVALDTDGKPRSARVEVKLYKVKWRWWWERGEESLADFVEGSSFVAIVADTVAVKGTGVFQFKVKYPDWGRYLLRARDLDGGHATGKTIYIDWPGWAGRGQKEMGGGATVLSFSSDKAEYTVGETVTLTIPTAKQGRGLVTIESGTRVLKAEWIEAAGTEARYTFKADGSMAPNVYACVTFLQPHLQAGNDLPIRMYGVIPIKVSDPGTVLKPSIACQDVFKPEQTAEITVSEEQGKAMTYTLAIVDEGLLDLTRFKTPNPAETFYAREALGVKTWDVYDQVMGAYGDALERLLAIGGDGEGDAKGGKKAQRFPPMVRFYGPFDLERGRKTTHTVDIPQYVGSVRVMVVAGRNGAYGAAEKPVFVRKPLMILGTLPRVLGPMEQVALPVSVFAMEPKVKGVTVSVKVTGALELEGDAKRKIEFSQPGDELVTFTLKGRETPGVAKVVIEAAGGGEAATQTIEIDVRAPGMPVADITSGEAAAGSSWNATARVPGLSGTNTVTLEVSRVLPLNLGRRLSWLIHYPYGCVEQTTSSVFPQLYLPKLIELSAERQKEVQKNVNAGIERLRLFQTSEGGFGYWPGDVSNEWGSNYAGNFLVEAEKAGYNVPGSMLDQWRRYQRNRAANWSSKSGNADGDVLTQAYRLYTLALAGAAEIGAMNRLREERAVPVPAQWHLAAAYQLAGQKEAAEAIAKRAGVSVRAYRELGGTFGSDVRDKAMILEAQVLLGHSDKALALARELSASLCAEQWMSTQSTAYALIALARHAGLDKSSELSFAYAWQDGKQISVKSSAAVAEVPLTLDPQKPLSIVVRNAGSGMLYPRVVATGIPAPGEEKSASNSMRIVVNYLTPDGTRIDPSTLEQGTDFVAEVTVRNTGSSGTFEQVALAHLAASGWEIRNARFEGTQGEKQDGFDYQDIRDDRVYTFFSIEQGKSRTYRVMLNAAYLGHFYLPMQSVAAMYDETLNAREQGRWVDVVEPGNE